MSDRRCSSLLADLGRPTRRGIRKCPKCGTYNGTRGNSCKSCTLVFKETLPRNVERKKPPRIVNDAVKITSCSNSQVYSVRLKEKGADKRGFVQLPTIESLNGVTDNLSEMTIYENRTACCFVDCCLKATMTGTSPIPPSDSESGLVSHPSTCSHIDSALNSFAESQVLHLRNSVLNAMQIPSETRNDIFSLATEMAGPLVQRICSQSMVVKCQASPKHPLGFLHAYFYETKRKKEKKKGHRFYCECSGTQSPKKGSHSKIASSQSCIHFYACLCAFASEESLSAEFSDYLHFQRHLNKTPTQMEHLLFFPPSPSPPSAVESSTFDLTLVNECPAGSQEDTLVHSNDLPVDLGPEDADLLAQSALLVEEESQNQSELIFQGNKFQCKRSKLFDASENFAVQMNGDTGDLSPFLSLSDCGSLLNLAEKSSTLLTTSFPQDSPPKKKPKLTLPKLSSIQSSPPPKKSPVLSPLVCVEASASLDFVSWLGGVTERLNQTMHYQFNGKPETLIFQVPQVFFNCLFNRISCGYRKRRIPNTMETFTNLETPPLGTFTRFIWKITNVLHVKSIFDTPKIPLEVSRAFVLKRDGSFEFIDSPDSKLTSLDKSLSLDKYSGKTETTPLIKPVQYKTFIRVGIMSATQTEPVPFTIEWVPDYFPKCQVGEMKIKFEFGHLKNGKLVECPKSQSRTEVSGVVATKKTVKDPIFGKLQN